MQPPKPPDRISVFLDTNAIYSTKEGIAEPSHLGWKLAPVDYYVPRFVLEERCVQLLQDYKKLCESGETFKAVGFALSLPPPPDRNVIHETIVRKLKASQEDSTVTVYESEPHDVATQELLFRARYQGAYKDVILLTGAAQYARAKRLGECIVVTGDKGFPGLQALVAPAFAVHTWPSLRERLQFDGDLYKALVERLLPQVGRLVAAERANFAAQGSHLPIGDEALAQLRSPEFDAATLSYYVYDLQVYRSDVPEDIAHPGRGGNAQPYQPNDVWCHFKVRFALPPPIQWGRLHFGRVPARIAYDRKKLKDVNVSGPIEMSWQAFG